MQPVFLTSLTTIVGFLSLNFSDAPPFRVLGNVVAIGVGAAWLVSVVFLPAWMAVMPFKVRLLGNGSGRFPRAFRQHDYPTSRAELLGFGGGHRDSRLVHFPVSN